MLLVYIVSTIVAGALLLLSLFGADHDADHEIAHDSEGGHWLPFFSLRFYTYFFAGFGTTGLLLHYLTDTNAVVGAWIAGAIGLAAGLSVSILVRILRVTETSGSAKEKDLLGKEAKVLVAIRGMTPGRIRCSVRGDLIDYLAVSESNDAIEAGESVVVVGMENGRAQVVPRASIFGEDALPERTT